MFHKKSKQRRQSTGECAASKRNGGDTIPKPLDEWEYLAVPLLEDILMDSLELYEDTSFEHDLMRWGQLFTYMPSVSLSRHMVKPKSAKSNGTSAIIQEGKG